MPTPGVDRNGPLAGRVALVTGASRGIGEAIAVRLAMAGAQVAISARTLAAGESRLSGSLGETVDRIRRAGGQAVAFQADLARGEERARLVDCVVEALGPVDILINNAAITYFAPVAEFTDKRLRLMMEVQVIAPFHLAQLVLPSMRARRQGWIVNISSGAGMHPKAPYRGGRGGTVYGLCKAALERFSTGLASEVADEGIAVNAISPGLVATPGVAVHGLINDETRPHVQPIEFIAEAVFRLAGGEPTLLTGRIAYAQPLLEELGVTPCELV